MNIKIMRDGTFYGSLINKLWFALFLFLFQQVSGQSNIKQKTDSALESHSSLWLSTFDVDVTPPVGSPLAYDPEINKWDLGLRAKGIVLSGAGKPIVMCAIDWLGIDNEGMDAFKNALAAAAGTVPQRVTVNVLHQHDAPRYDAGAEQILLEAGLDPAVIHPSNFDGTFPREALRHLTIAVRNALDHTQPINYLGLGEATVDKVASNRNIYGADGKVRDTRYSTAKDAAFRAAPEGVIDPVLSLVSFWNGDKPVAILSYYATHPQSYYRTGIANPDFPGIARFFRQLAIPDALSIHFDGAGGNVAAGKYNDGSHENRLILATRLADGMKRAWDATRRQVITAKDVDWVVEPVSLPPAKYLYKLQEDLSKNNTRLLENKENARKLAWLKRCEAGKQLDVACLKLKNARILYMPGELFVEYQLAAKAQRPDLFVAMAAYGDLGPGYIGTAKAYEKGGYEVSELASNVAPGVEAILMQAISKLLH
jgi:hypothetical protein